MKTLLLLVCLALVLSVSSNKLQGCKPEGWICYGGWEDEECCPGLYCRPISPDYNVYWLCQSEDDVVGDDGVGEDAEDWIKDGCKQGNVVCYSDSECCAGLSCQNVSGDFNRPRLCRDE